MKDAHKTITDDLIILTEKHRLEMEPPEIGALLIAYAAFLLKQTAPDKKSLRNFWEMMMRKIDTINNEREN